MSKTPVYQIIGNFLKSNINIPYTISDLVNNLKLNPSTVRSSLSYLSKGRKLRKKGKVVLTKTGKERRVFYKGFSRGKVKNTSKGEWLYYGKVKYESWIVDFKLRDTKSTHKPKNRWDKEIMDLTGSAKGIVPSTATKRQIIDVSATKLFQESLEIMADNGVVLWNSVDEDDSKVVVFGARKNDNETIDNKYDPEWEGKLHFTNNVGSSYEFDVKYKILESKY